MTVSQFDFMPETRHSLAKRVKQGAILPDSLGKAHRYRDLAEECEKLGVLATDDQIRGRYHKIAENYLDMARTELKRADQDGVPKR